MTVNRSLDEKSFERGLSPILNEQEKKPRNTFLLSASISVGALLGGILLGLLLSKSRALGSPESDPRLEQFRFVEENSMYTLQGDSSRLQVVPKDDYWCVKDKIDAYVREQQELLNLNVQGDELGEEIVEAWNQETVQRFLDPLPERSCPISGELTPVLEATFSHDGRGPWQYRASS